MTCTNSHIAQVHTHLRDYGGLVNVFAVAPSVHTALLLQIREVDVSARNESLSRQISDNIQPVSAAAAQLLLPIHHLTVTVTQTNWVTFPTTVRTVHGAMLFDRFNN